MQIVALTWPPASKLCLKDVFLPINISIAPMYSRLGRPNFIVFYYFILFHHIIVVCFYKICLIHLNYQSLKLTDFVTFLSLSKFEKMISRITRTSSKIVWAQKGIENFVINNWTVRKSLFHFLINIPNTNQNFHV